jgi:hypothetical protein
MDESRSSKESFTVTSERRSFLYRYELLSCLGIVALLSIALNSSLIASGHLASALMTPGADVAEQVWCLAWLPHALAHGINPFYSDALFAGSGGFNLMANTSLFFPAVVLMPITVLGGPILALNIGILLTPVVCAWPMYRLARRFTPSFSLAAVATVLWVLSPYAVINLASGHFHQTVSFFPPVVVLLALDLVQRRRSPLATGVWGGLAVVAQFFTGSELLAMTAMEFALGLIAIAIWKRAFLLTHWRDGVKALAVAGSLALLILGYPLYIAFFGARHTTGSPWGDIYDFGITLKSLVSAPWGLGHGLRITHWAGPNEIPVEPVSYLGWGLVIAAVATVIFCFRQAKVRALTLVVAVTLVAAFGVTVQYEDASTTIASWAPWRLVQNLPIFEQLIPSRLTQLLGFGVVLLALLGAETARRRLAGMQQATRLTLAFLAIAAICVPQIIAANAPYPSFVVKGAGEPPFFRYYASNHGPHARLLVLPDPVSGLGNQSAPMTYQALAHFSYSLIDGYFLVPTTHSSASAFRVPPSGASGLIQNFISPVSVNPLTPRQRQMIVDLIIRRRVTTVALTPIISQHSLAAAEVTALMGSRPHETWGTLWWNVEPSLHPLDISTDAVSKCAAETVGLKPEISAECVLRAARDVRPAAQP